MERFSRKPNMSPSHQFPTSACRRVWALLRALELSLATKTNTRAWHVWHVGIHGILNHLPSWIQRIDFLWFLYLAQGVLGRPEGCWSSASKTIKSHLQGSQHISQDFDQLIHMLQIPRLWPRQLRLSCCTRPIRHNFPSIALLWPTACHHNIMIQEEHEEVQGTNWYKLIIGQTSSLHGLLHPENEKTCWQPSVFVRETWICCRTSQSAPDACPTSLLILCCTRKYSSTLIQTQKQSINQSERSDKKQVVHGTTLPIPVNLPFL